MGTFRQALGRFSSVNGAPVHQRFPRLSTTTWAHGHPIGILWHYTAGCTNGVFGSGSVGAQFNVGRDGSIYQGASARSATWHAYGASHYWIGIEHTALPGHCELTDIQLEASARLSAALVQYISSTWHFAVPLTHHPTPDYEPGFKDHRDGTVGTWNLDGHTDHLYHWTWTQYLAKIGGYLHPNPPPPPVVTKHWMVDDLGPFIEADAEHAVLTRMRAVQAGHAADPDTAPDQVITVVRKAAPIP